MTLKLVLPKGRIYNEVVLLLNQCGIALHGDERNYRPIASDTNLAVKLLKSQNIPPLVALGQHDIGFAGYDWIVEQNAEVEELLDLALDPVRIVVCIPEIWQMADLRARSIIAVSEYQNLTTKFLTQQGFEFTFVRSYGSTEVFPPEDADLIVDNTSTGSTLQANRLKITDTILHSSTRFIACRRALDDIHKRNQIEDLLLLMKSVLNGRGRVLLEMNCSQDNLATIVKLLPAMRSPTIAPLYQDSGFSVKAAINIKEVKTLIPKLIAAGATDILETPIRKVI